MFGSCYLRTLRSLCFLLPKPCQVCCSRVCSSHASSCPWPTANWKMLIAKKWGQCSLHFIFYSLFWRQPIWFWALLILSLFCSPFWGAVETHLCWLAVGWGGGEKDRSRAFYLLTFYIYTLLGCCTENQTGTQNAQESVVYEPYPALNCVWHICLLEDLCRWYRVNSTVAWWRKIEEFSYWCVTTYYQVTSK